MVFLFLVFGLARVTARIRINVTMISVFLIKLMASSDPSTGASEKGGTWVQLEQQSMAPPPRFGASLTACGDEVLLFGGCQEDASGGMHFYNDLYRLALRLTIESELDYIWEMVPSTGQIPAPRESHCACAVKGTNHNPLI